MAHPRILVAVHPSDGQSSKIAHRVARRLRWAGANVDVEPVELAPAPQGFDAVVLGDSIHVSRHSAVLTDYVRLHAAGLDLVPSALFQVSMTSANPDAEHTEAAELLARRFCDETGYAPSLVGLFGGALAYTRYGWWKRRLVRAVAARGGLDTDIARDREYTDWAAVDRFATDVYALALAPRPTTVRWTT